MSSPALSAASVWRRLIVCAAVLLAADFAVLPLLRYWEPRRYESDKPLRFENSDFFLLGPLVEYLKENPVGQKPRVVFFGNSVVWGYFLEAHQTIPARFQQWMPQVRVINCGVNRLQTGSAYLITKQLLDSVEAVVLVVPGGDAADPLLPALIPLLTDDAERFGLSRPSPWQVKAARLGRFWRLKRYAYRLQGAWFGTSTRQFVYLNKSRWIKALLGRRGQAVSRDPLPVVAVAEGVWLSPRAAVQPSDGELQGLRNAHLLLYDYAQLVLEHKRRGVIVQFSGQRGVMSPEQLKLFNAHFAPYVTAVEMRIPQAWLTADKVHLTAAGSAGVAQLIYQHAPATLGLGAP